MKLSQKKECKDCKALKKKYNATELPKEYFTCLLNIPVITRYDYGVAHEAVPQVECYRPLTAFRLNTLMNKMKENIPA